MSIDRGVDKEGMPIHNGVLCSHQKGWNNAICGDMDGPETVILNEISQTERKKCCMISILCGI